MKIIINDADYLIEQKKLKIIISNLSADRNAKKYPVEKLRDKYTKYTKL